MLVNRSSLNAVFVNLKAIYGTAFAAAPQMWPQIAMKVPSTSRENTYGWLSHFPMMRRWIGEKTIRALSAHSYTVVNDDWEATVEVDRNDLEDDNLGIYAPQALMAGYSAKQLGDTIIAELVNGGFSNKCYDGQPFFSTSHKVGKKSVSNRGTATLSIASLAEAQASYGAARAAMRKFTDEDGRPLMISPGVLLVPPALEDVATALMTSERLEDGKVNIYRGTAQVVSSALLTSDTAWFLLDCSRPVRPFVYQERKKPVFVSQTDLNSDNVFLRKKYRFGAEARAAGGYGFWQMAYGSTGS